MQGTIHRLIRGKGFGFIQTPERQYFFHHSEVRGIEFRQLTVGDVVEFQPVEEEAGKNPRAVELSVLVKAPSPPPRAPSEASHGPPRRPRQPGQASRPQGAGPRRPRQDAPADNFGTGLFEAGEAGFDSVDADGEFSEELPQEGSFEIASEEGEPGGGEEAPSFHPPAHRSSGHNRGGGRGPGAQGGGGRRGEPRTGRGRRGGGRPRGEEKPRRPKATGVPGERGEGVVRSINIERGFGFIETATGDLFFHKSGVREGFESLDVGSRVAFVFGEGERGAKAEDVSAV